MSRRSVLAEAIGLSLNRRRHATTGDAHAEDATLPSGDESPMIETAEADAPQTAPAIEPSPLAEIFASIRNGESPWTLDELPADTGATSVLLSELDRLWQNPE
jgi:hypothetical protein